MKRVLSLVLAAIMIIGSLAACQQAAAPSSSTAAPASSAAAPASSAAASSSAEPVAPEDVTMRYSWWGTDTRHEATINAIQEYQTLNPHVTIEPEYGQFDAMLEKLYIQLASKTAPDIISCDIKWVFDMIRNYNDSFVNIKNTIIDMSGFDPDFVNKTCGTEEFTLGVPTSITYQFATYNPEFLTKFGLEEFGEPGTWDWETLSKAGAKAASQDPNAHLMFTYKTGWIYMLKAFYKQSSGVDIINADYSVNYTVADATEFFNYVVEIIGNGTVGSFEEMVPYDKDYVYNNPGWLTGNFGMGVQAASHMPSIKSNTPFETGVAMPPVRKGAVDVGWPVSTSMILGIYAYGNPEEAAKFVDWHINDEKAIEILSDKRGLPANSKAQQVLGDLGIIMPEMLKANDLFFEMNDAVVKGQVSAENGSVNNSLIADLIYEFVQEVGYGRMTPEAGADAFVTELTKLCGTLK